MKKSILSSRFHLKRLPLILFSLASTCYFSQTAKQKEKIKTETNKSQLSLIKQSVAVKRLQKVQLQSKAKQLNIPYSGETKGKFYQLQGFEPKTNRPLYYITNNADASAATETNKLNSSGGLFNLDGQGINLAEWDGGTVNVTHQEFGGRAIQYDTPQEYSDHSTHVAGTMIASGVDPKAKGMAPKANLFSFDWNNDIIEMTGMSADGTLLSNHSYSYVGGFTYANYSGSYGWHWFGDDADTEFWGYGKYLSYDAEHDLIANNAPYYLQVKAAGNPRGDGPEAGGLHYVNIDNVWVESTKTRQKNGGEYGFDCLMYGGVAKNNLVVAAAEKLPNNTYTSASDVKAAYFSAFGPTDDGRIKPDITGIGVDIYSTILGGTNSYGSSSGTSMASPNVTGSLGLLQQHYQNLNSGAFMKATTVKALIFTTAKEAGNVGPDYKYGWGLLDAYQAASTISTKDKLSLIQERTLNNNAQDVIQFVANGNEPIIATIVWNDPTPDTFGGSTGTNDRTRMLVNDLDSRISDGTNTYNPWVLDPENPNNPATTGDNIIDNTEQIYIANPIAGATYTLTVSHKGTLKKSSLVEDYILIEDADSQDYSLVVKGIKGDIQTDIGFQSLKIDVQPTAYTSTTPVTATYSNNGASTIDGAQLKYSLINTDTNSVVSTNTIDLPSINTGASATETFNVDLKTPYINYTIKAELILNGDEVESNNISTVSTWSTLVDLTELESNHSFGFENDFEKYGWTAEDVDGDGRTWYKYNSSSFAHTGNSFAANYPGYAYLTDNINNDYLFSNPIKMKGGGEYRVTFYMARYYNQLNQEPLKVYFGSSPNSGAMTKVIAQNLKATKDYVRYTFAFTPTTDGIYYIGFQHNNPTASCYTMFLDDIYIDQSSKPIPDFYADKTDTNSYETITLANKTYTLFSRPITAWEWTFEPNTVTYVNGTTSASKEPQVKLAEGTYNVTLKATNKAGDGSLTKQSHIVVDDILANADFTVNEQNVYPNGTVTFTNTSSGRPAPTTWNWEITPSTGVTFVNSTDATSENPAIQFANAGTYTVALTATSLSGADTETKTDFITVTPYGAVRNLTGVGDENKNVTLNWERPKMDYLLYTEGFETNYDNISNRFDEDGDTEGWWDSYNYSSEGNWSVVSSSWDPDTGLGKTVRNWLVTTEIPKGGERLSYSVLHIVPEAYDINVITKEEIAGASPTLEELKTKGHIVYTHDDDYVTKDNVFEPRVVDISAYRDSNIFIAFLHRTTEEMFGYTLYIDNIKVGFKDNITGALSTSKKATSKEEKEEPIDYRALLKEGKVIVDPSLVGVSTVKDVIKTQSIPSFNVDTPPFVGYEIVRDGSTVSTIDNMNTLTYTETVPEYTSYTYDVYVLYDGVKSDKQTVIVDLTGLSTTEVLGKDNMKVFPNPSSGNFKVDGGNNVSALDAQVFDLSGKLILSKKSTSRYLDIDLTSKGKGVYILVATDNNGNKYSVKLIVK